MSACGYPGQYPAYEGGWPLSPAPGQAECRGQTLILVSQPHCREWGRGRAHWWPGSDPGGLRRSAEPLSTQARSPSRSRGPEARKTEAGEGAEPECEHWGEWWGHRVWQLRPPPAQAAPAEHGRGPGAGGRGGPPQVRVHPQHGGGQREHRALRHTVGQAGVSPCYVFNVNEWKVTRAIDQSLCHKTKYLLRFYNGILTVYALIPSSIYTAVVYMKYNMDSDKILWCLQGLCQCSQL